MDKLPSSRIGLPEEVIMHNMLADLQENGTTFEKFKSAYIYYWISLHTFEESSKSLQELVREALERIMDPERKSGAEKSIDQINDGYEKFQCKTLSILLIKELRQRGVKAYFASIPTHSFVVTENTKEDPLDPGALWQDEYAKPKRKLRGFLDKRAS